MKTEWSRAWSNTNKTRRNAKGKAWRKRRAHKAARRNPETPMRVLLNPWHVT